MFSCEFCENSKNTFFHRTPLETLQWSCDIEEFIQGGTTLVDEKTGGILQGSFDRREMVKGGETFSHKCSRTSRIKVCNPNIHKEFVALDHSCSSRQQSCSGISLDGWYSQSTTSKTQQVNLKLYAVLSDPNYSRVPSKQVECQSRLKVQECNRLIWLETSSESLSKVCGVENYRKTLEIEGISSSVAKFISMSRRPGEITGFESTWYK